MTYFLCPRQRAQRSCRRCCDTTQHITQLLTAVQFLTRDAHVWN